MLHCAMLKNALQRCGNRCEKWSLILLRAVLLSKKMLRDFIIARHIAPRNSLATCVATELRDKLHSVTVP